VGEKNQDKKARAVTAHRDKLPGPSLSENVEQNGERRLDVGYCTKQQVTSKVQKERKHRSKEDVDARGWYFRNVVFENYGKRSQERGKRPMVHSRKLKGPRCFGGWKLVARRKIAHPSQA